jgi:chemotaxis protein methyltransferase CheR
MTETIALLENDFNRLSQFIHQQFGIKMPPAKKVLLESRLQKRLRALDINTFKAYCDYLLSPQGRDNELVNFIDKITTNKTDFFREAEHFSFLTNQLLPELTTSREDARHNLTVWSAGCSTGEEPYTLAMVLNQFKDLHPELSFDYSIIGTDISMEVLRNAKTAVYKESCVDPIPLALKKKYLLRSKNKEKQLIKIVPLLRNKVNFYELNFMEHHYPMDKNMDIIFCRNVIIYFDKPTQKKILNKICQHLRIGGYFFQGHSESLQGFNLPLKAIYPTIYQKIDN